MYQGKNRVINTVYVTLNQVIDANFLGNQTIWYGDWIVYSVITNGRLLSTRSMSWGNVLNVIWMFFNLKTFSKHFTHSQSKFYKLRVILLPKLRNNLFSTNCGDQIQLQNWYFGESWNSPSANQYTLMLYSANHILHV